MRVRSALGRAISGATGARFTKQPPCQTVIGNTINNLTVNEGRSAAARGGLLRAAATHCGRHLLVLLHPDAKDNQALLTSGVRACCLSAAATGCGSAMDCGRAIRRAREVSGRSRLTA